MSNQAKHEPITIDLRPTRTAQPAQHETWQMQAAPDSYQPRRMPMAGNLPEMFEWIMCDGLAMALGALA